LFNCLSLIGNYSTSYEFKADIVKIRTILPSSQLTAPRDTTKLSNLTKAKVAFQPVRRPVNGTPRERHPLAEAMEWVAILTTIALEMVLPGLAGQWLDGRLGTRFLVLVGFVFGLSFGIWHLVLVTKPKSDPPKRKK